MRTWPINLDLTDQPCLVVGGGEVGQRKVTSLLSTGAQVRLAGRELTPALSELITQGRVRYLGSEFDAYQLDGVVLVLAATSDHELNARISLEARSKGLWVNVADNPELSSFLVPATLRRGDLTISVGTGGASPALAARIKASLEEQFGPEYGPLTRLLGLIRTKVLAAGHPAGENRKTFRRLVESDLQRLLAAEEWDRAQALLQDILGPEYTWECLDFSTEAEGES